ncbi:carboxypeptidase-like regulatory domain-containing protein [Flagellimonas meridianipacifica]|uniref:Carboxypeptidase-like protein n=1 Tax=Flagellimonas meridianipacifica TaxID=1080225 RepID=A0A2T0M6G4_9FLAO|nr:carboxypeptidase-like regulatory domain-containing protein [Allomuricauda pacifica]PRX53048.1 carboxypeptidase-like protein [Allomuricauda pacifica]
MNSQVRFKCLPGLFFFLMVFTGISQKSRLLRGKIVSINNDIQNITIQNTNSKQATITKEDGSFSILVNLNDTLVFSAVQFKTRRLVVSKAIYNSNSVLIEMEEFVNQLDEVVVQPYNLSGNLNEDLGGLQLEKDVSAEALGLPNAEVRIISQSENKLKDADNGKYLYIVPLGIAFNVNKTLNRLSGRTKMLKNRVKLDEEYATIQEIENKYLDSVLISHLKIPNDRFHEFFYYCQMDDTFQEIQKRDDELVLWEFLLKKSKSYRLDNKLD